MTKPEIEAFLAVVQYGSISAAAEQIYVTQPALTRRIQNLEKELDYRLFARGKGIRGSSLTVRGRAFLPIAQRWSGLYREAYALQDRDERPTFRLAAIGSAGRLLLGGIFSGMSSGETPYHLDFHLCHSVEGYSLIEGGAADAVLIDYLRSSVYSTGAVLSAPVYAVPFVVVGGSAWKGVRSVRAETLDPSREIVLPWNTAFDAWHDRCFDPGIRHAVDLDDSASVQYLLRDDLFAVMPATEARRLVQSGGEFYMADLVDGPPDEIIHCLTSPEGNESPVFRRFLDIVRRCCEAEPGVRCLLGGAAGHENGRGQ